LEKSSHTNRPVNFYPVLNNNKIKAF